LLTRVHASYRDNCGCIVFKWSPVDMKEISVNCPIIEILRDNVSSYVETEFSFCPRKVPKWFRQHNLYTVIVTSNVLIFCRCYSQSYTVPCFYIFFSNYIVGKAYDTSCHYWNIGNPIFLNSILRHWIFPRVFSIFIFTCDTC
jgi:hypothetical protein